MSIILYNDGHVYVIIIRLLLSTFFAQICLYIKRVNDKFLTSFLLLHVIVLRLLLLGVIVVTAAN